MIPGLVWLAATIAGVAGLLRLGESGADRGGLLLVALLLVWGAWHSFASLVRAYLLRGEDY